MFFHPAQWSARCWLRLILLGALAARLGFLALFGGTLSLQTSGYDVYAVNVMRGHGYTRFVDRHADADLPPLYVFTLVAIYSIVGRSAINVALVQIGFDLLTIFLIYQIGRRAFPARGPTPALFGAAFTAFYPYMLFQDLSVNDTAIFVLLLAAGVWGAYRAEAAFHTGTGPSRAALGWAAFAGLTFGLAALTKTVVLLLIPLLAWWWLRRVGRRRAAPAALLVCTVTGLVMLPWIVRNSRLFGELVLTSTNDGSNLHQGNNSCAADYLANGWDVQWVNCYPPMPTGLGELEQSRWHREQAIRWLLEHPGQWLRHFGQKFLTLWNPQITPFSVPPPEFVDETGAFVDDAVMIYETPSFQAARTVHFATYTPLLILGLAGWALAARHQQGIGPLLAVLTAITAAYLIFHPSTRYRMPADPFLFLLSGYAVAWSLERLRRGAAAPSPISDGVRKGEGDTGRAADG